MSPDLYHQLCQALQTGPAVLAVVTQVSGSVPREAGAKMVIRSDGQTFDTIGGGAGEARVIRQAHDVLASQLNRQVIIDLSGAAGQETDGVCGGWMEVWLVYLAQTWDAQAIAGVLEGTPHSWLVWPLQPQAQPYVMLGQPDWPCLPHRRDAPDGAENTGPVFAEPIQPSPLLLIVGAGHCAIPLAQMAHLSGFRIAIYDNRPEFASAQRFPHAQILLTGPIGEIGDVLQPYPSRYVALVTRGIAYDQAALTVLLQQPFDCDYIGMMGSRRRVRQVFQNMVDQGFSPAQLQSIRAPIGLEIGALTPAEIAVSICAELIQARRQGQCPLPDSGSANGNGRSPG